MSGLSAMMMLIAVHRDIFCTQFIFQCVSSLYSFDLNFYFILISHVVKRYFLTDSHE